MAKRTCTIHGNIEVDNCYNRGGYAGKILVKNHQCKDIPIIS